MKLVKSIAISTFLFVAIAAATVLTLSGSKSLMGWQTFIVKSGSMEPAIDTGSLIFVEKQSTYSEQDIISFRSPTSPDTVITHRIVSIDEDHTLVTKGDANADNDTIKVPLQSVLGTVRWHLPFVGYVLSFLQTPLGAVLFLLIPGTILVYEEVKSLHRTINDSLLSKETALSILLLFASVFALSVPVSYATYAHTAQVSSITFSTSNWLHPEISAQIHDNDLLLALTNSQGVNNIEYIITYKHSIDGSIITEQIMGTFTKDLNQPEYQSDVIYLGTCSETECTPHQDVENVHIVGILKYENSVISEQELNL